MAKNMPMAEVIEILKYVETHYDSTAIGDNGKSFGILQIQQMVIYTRTMTET